MDVEVTSTSTILGETLLHLKDIAKYLVYDIICGPLQSSLLTGAAGCTSGRWSIPQYPLVLETFNAGKDLNREEEYELTLSLNIISHCTYYTVRTPSLFYFQALFTKFLCLL